MVEKTGFRKEEEAAIMVIVIETLQLLLLLLLKLFILLFSSCYKGLFPTMKLFLTFIGSNLCYASLP